MRSLLWSCLLLAGMYVAPASAQPRLQNRIDAAAPGDTIVVRGGSWDGPLWIDKPLVLQGRDRPHVHGHGKGHVITITAPDVTVAGFRITDSGMALSRDHAGIMIRGRRATVHDNHLANVLHGIYVKASTRATIANNVIAGPPTVIRRVSADEARTHGCTVPATGGTCAVPLVPAQRGNGIHLWKSTHNTIAHNVVHHTRDGIYFSFADHTYVAHNAVHGVRYGLHFMYSDDNTFEHNRFYGNASGSALMYSTGLAARYNVFRDNRTQRGYGLLLQTMDDSHFVENRMLRNGTGLYLENSTRNTFHLNQISANYRGLRITGSSTRNRFGENVIHGNLQAAAVDGISATNAWQIDGTGNYWGPRGLLDLDGDGISELPRRTVDLMSKRRAAFPYVGLLAGSPGLALLAEALQRVPVPGVPTLTDDRPLMRPPTAVGRAGTNNHRAFLLALLIGAAGLVLLRSIDP